MRRFSCCVRGVLGALLAILCCGSPGAAEESFLVVRHIAPVMKAPAPYKAVEKGRGILDRPGIEACVYYGSRVTVAPAPGKHGAQWVLLRFRGKTLGYLEKNALIPFPAHRETEPQAFCVRPEKLPLYLLPGKRSLSGFSDFTLPRGVTVTGVGRASAAGEEWILLRFASATYDDRPADLLTRYAWARKGDLIRLGTSYRPDTTRVRPDQIPSVVLTRQDDSSQSRFTLGEGEKRRLQERGFVVQTQPVILPELEVDDLVEAYPRVRDHVTPLFLTADLGLHCFHLIFDRMLQKTEERFFLPAVTDLLGRMQRGLEAQKAPLCASPRGREVYETVRDYLGVARRLLTGSGDLSPLGKGEVERILAAQGRRKSPFSGKEEDYTLYKPRGHYTLTPELQRYFRALSFLGGVTFTLKGPDPAVGQRNAGVVGVLCSLLEEPGTQGAWKKVFDPFTYLVGASNDNSWYDYAPTVRRSFSPSVPGDAAKLEAFRAALVAVSRPPLILSAPAPRVGASQGEREDEALGFRFIGRRFTFDALVFGVLTSPRTGSDEVPRNLPDPLDVMAVLGSTAARVEAKSFEAVPRYRENQEKLRALWRGFDKDPLSRNVYTGMLRIYSDYFRPTEGGQFFARSPWWEVKKLLTASASWAELKHDTILYGEQSGAEMGDGGDVWYAPAFLTPEPRGYVEPEPRLFAGLAEASRRTREFLTRSGFRDQEYPKKLQAFAALMTRLEGIAAKEVQRGEIHREDYRFIREFPAELSRELLLPETMLQLYPPVTEEVRDRLRMALVADVATDHLAGRALHVATGAPRHLLVFVDDPWGGPRVTRGAVYSFYSFPRPLAEGRLDDQAWKKRVYGGKQGELDALRPGWVRRLED